MGVSKEAKEKGGIMSIIPVNKQLKPNQEFEENISLLLTQSLSEEQRFLQAVLNGEIQTYSHDEVIGDLRRVLKR